MAERDKLPGYSIDNKGYKAELGIHKFLRTVGVWRPIDIDDQGNLTIQQPRFSLRDRLRDNCAIPKDYGISGTVLDLESRPK